MNNQRVQIKTIENKADWEHFLLEQDLPPFLQSWNAAEMNEALGFRTLRLGLYEQNTLIGICLVEQIRARRGNFLFIPYGPVLRKLNKEAVFTLLAYLTKWGKEHKFDFIRISPYWERTPEALEMLKQAGFRISPIHMLSELVWKLDLNQDEQDLLKQMRKTTRNLIRRAEKDGVKINTSTEVEALDHFLALMKETHKRHSFIAYPDELYLEQVKQFRNDNQVLVFNGEHDGKTLASAIIMYYGNAGSYHHGASIPSKIPVAYFLQWQAILEAKRRGCKEYSFWGVIDTDNKKHPFYGITTFKKGFGGDARYLVPAHDKPLSGRYFITYLIESMRRVRRGFGWRRT